MKTKSKIYHVSVRNDDGTVKEYDISLERSIPRLLIDKILRGLSSLMCRIKSWRTVTPGLVIAGSGLVVFLYFQISVLLNLSFSPKLCESFDGSLHVCMDCASPISLTCGGISLLAVLIFIIEHLNKIWIAGRSKDPIAPYLISLLGCVGYFTLFVLAEFAHLQEHFLVFNSIANAATIVGLSTIFWGYIEHEWFYLIEQKSKKE